MRKDWTKRIVAMLLMVTLSSSFMGCGCGNPFTNSDAAGEEGAGDAFGSVGADLDLSAVVDPVSIEVTLDADAAEEAAVEVVSLDDTVIPALSAGSVGYIAPAYEITCDGTFDLAELVFTYDPSLKESDPNMQPTVYWYNEEEHLLEEVSGQVDEGGVVRATVTHFSIYTLMDKSAIERQVKKMLSFDVGSMDDDDQDGLSDSYVQMLNRGEILCENSTILYGVLDMFGTSDDWDGDGLKNGEEIYIRSDILGHVYVYMTSNPLLVDTDNDGIDDYREVNLTLTDPMRYDRRSVGAYDQLKNDQKYAYTMHRSEWREEFAKYWMWNRKEDAKEFLINYFYEYASEETVNKNAEQIAEQKAFENAVEMLGVVSNLVRVADQTVSVFESGISQAELEMNDLSKSDYEALKELRLPTLEIQKRIIESINSKNEVLFMQSVQNLDMIDKISKIADIRLDSDLSTVSGQLNEVISACSAAMNLYTTAWEIERLSFYSEVSDYVKYAGTYKSVGDISKIKSVTSIAVYTAGTAVDALQVYETYGKLKANGDAYITYIELLHDIAVNSEHDYIRDAASDLARIIEDQFQDKWLSQLQIAGGTIVAADTFAAIVNIVSKIHPALMIIAISFNIAPHTGVGDQARYNVYFEIMADISDSCQRILDRMVTRHTQTFSYDSSDAMKVEDHLVQLAQARIVGDYYMYEYFTEGGAAGWVNRLINNQSEEEIMEQCKTRLAETYRNAGRLQLNLSSNLPYYDELFDSSVQEDELDLPLDANIAMRESAGVYFLRNSISNTYTFLYLDGKGSFTGEYYDRNAGESGVSEDGTAYAMTWYYQNFSGRYSLGDQIREDSFVFNIDEIQYEDEVGEEWFIDDWNGNAVYRYVAYEVGGISGAQGYILHGPDVYLEDNYMYEARYSEDPDYTLEAISPDGEYSVYFNRGDADTYQSYSEAYLNYLSEYNADGELPDPWVSDSDEYVMLDLTGNGTPEMVIHDTQTNQMCVLQYRTGTVNSTECDAEEIYLSGSDEYPGFFIKNEGEWKYGRLVLGGSLFTSTVAVEDGNNYVRKTWDDDLYQVFLDMPKEPVVFQSTDQGQVQFR